MSVPNGGGSPLRREEEHGGSIVFLCMKLVRMMFGPQFQWLPIGCRWSLGHQDCQKIALGFFPHRCLYSIGRGPFPFRLAIPLSGQLRWGFYGTPHNEFLGRAQVVPTFEEVRDLCPQRLQIV